MKFQDKFYDIIDHNKCPSSEKSDEKCILRKSNFHQILPTHAMFADATSRPAASSTAPEEHIPATAAPLQSPATGGPARGVNRRSPVP